MSLVICPHCHKQLDASTIGSLMAKKQWQKKPFSSKEMRRRAKLSWKNRRKNKNTSQ